MSLEKDPHVSEVLIRVVSGEDDPYFM